jgi:hypothetical protein
MKNTSCVQMLVLSLAFTAVYFTASPMKWVDMQSSPSQRMTDALKVAIANDLATQRQAPGWGLWKSQETVEHFFAQNAPLDVLSVLFELGEYGHATRALQNFLNRPNGDIAKHSAYKAAWDFAAAGNFPVINTLLDYHMACFRSAPSLMSQDFLNDTLSLIIMGLIASEQAFNLLATQASTDQAAVAKAPAIKGGIQAKYRAFLQDLLKYSNPEMSGSYEARYNATLDILDRNMWNLQTPLWMKLASIDVYQNIGFGAPSSEQLAADRGAFSSEESGSLSDDAEIENQVIRMFSSQELNQAIAHLNVSDWKDLFV